MPSSHYPVSLLHEVALQAPSRHVALLRDLRDRKRLRSVLRHPFDDMRHHVPSSLLQSTLLEQHRDVGHALDGVVVIPQKHEDVVIEKALEKAGAENLVRKEIEENGMSGTDAFKKYGVL